VLPPIRYRTRANAVRESSFPDSADNLRIDLLTPRGVWTATAASQIASPRLSRKAHATPAARSITARMRIVRPEFQGSLRSGTTICFRLALAISDDTIPENIPLDILLRGRRGLVVVKQPGRVVGSPPPEAIGSGTVTSAIASRSRVFSVALRNVGGPTRTGNRPAPSALSTATNQRQCMLCAEKTNAVHLTPVHSIHDRKVSKATRSNRGRLDWRRDWISRLSGRHPYNATNRRSVKDTNPANRATFYEVVRRTGPSDRVKVSRKTRRTHQIRVHRPNIRLPIFCDRRYAGHSTLPLGVA